MHRYQSRHFIQIILLFILLTALFVSCKKNDAQQASLSKNTTENFSGNASKELLKTNSIVFSLSLASIMQNSLTKFSALSNKNLTPFPMETEVGLKELFHENLKLYISDLQAYDVLPPHEAKKLNGMEIFIQGFSIVSHPALKLSSLSQKNLQDIFSGKMNNWKSLSGEDLPVTVVSYAPPASHRFIFKKYVLFGLQENDLKSTLLTDVASIKKKVAEIPGAISYVPTPWMLADASIKTIQLEELEPTTENIISGKYPLWYPIYVYFNGSLSDDETKVVEFLKSEAFHATLREGGYIPSIDIKMKR